MQVAKSKTRKAIPISKIIKYIGDCQINDGLNDKKRHITGIAPLHCARATDLAWSRNREQIVNSKSVTILCPPNLDGIDGKTLICVENPRLWFIRVAKRFFNIPKPAIKIGKNVHMEKGIVIGGEGFGYERNEKAELEKFPHFGGVIIGDNVEIGANTCIARGSLEDTIIGNGTKIDQLTHISHNVKIGNHCLITACTFIGGGAEIGDYVTVWAGAIIFDHVKVGHHAIIGAGAVVTKDVKPYETVVGMPARNIEQFRQHARNSVIP